jgi:hypothetical protein
MDNILKLWRDKLAKVQAMYEGSVQIPLHSADVKTVLEQNCPDEFTSLRDELKQRMPTHVLLRPEQLESLLSHVEVTA